MLKKNHLIFKDTDISAGFLNNSDLVNSIFITLFLDQKKINLIQKETFSGESNISSPDANLIAIKSFSLNCELII